MRIRTLLILLALAICLGLWPLFPARRAARDPIGRLACLYEECRYFELRDGLADLEADPAPDLEFFRGAVDQVFNRLEPAVRRLKGYLNAGRSGPPRMLMKEAWVLIADAYRRLGRYGDAAEAYRQALLRFGPVLDREERTNLENHVELWSALAGVPGQTVEIAANTTVRMTERRFPVRVTGRTVLFGYDTGSNVCILYASAAAELGIESFGPPVRVQTGSGYPVEGRIGLVPEMGWGSVRLGNVLVLVLPDELFPDGTERPGAGRKGLLGMPVLEALKEVTETRGGDLIVPARPASRPGRNMCLSGLMPVVEAVHRGVRLRLCVDTGAATTSLFPPYYRRFRGEINSRARVRESTVGGIGSSRRVPVRLLDEFAFRAGGKDFALRRIMVQTAETHADSRYFDGTIGVDILSLCSRMTLDFASMAFVLE